MEPAADTPDSSFAAVTAVRPVATGRFAATVHPNWTIGGKPNGGYLLAMIGRAVTEVSAHEHVIAASAHYLHSPDPGPVEIGVEVLRSGRSASQLRAWLSQDGRPCVETLMTTSRLDPAAEPYWSAGVPQRGTAPPERAIRVPGVNPAGIPVPIMDEVDLRIDRDTMTWARGEPTGRGELRGWLSFLDGATWDPVALLYAVDAFPPATFDVEPTGWVPTLELTAYVRALPAPGGLQVLHRAHLIDSQRVDEQSWVWDTRGRVVAHATQLAGIRLG